MRRGRRREAATTGCCGLEAALRLSTGFGLGAFTGIDRLNTADAMRDGVQRRRCRISRPASPSAAPSGGCAGACVAAGIISGSSRSPLAYRGNRAKFILIMFSVRPADRKHNNPQRD
ncbi:hypothetical protein KCP69_11025 [Salmonella enterica subsp. enterica]|nr:hypothetical protein KCP69_11025 [Salmonella enterica subsp. enterica]